MSKLIQFRCPKCLRLLFKWETGKDIIQAREGVQFIKVPEGKMDVVCSKCNTRLEILKDRLAIITIKKSEIPLNVSGLSNHIATPELIGSQTKE